MPKGFGQDRFDKADLGAKMPDLRSFFQHQLLTELTPLVRWYGLALLTLAGRRSFEELLACTQKARIVRRNLSLGLALEPAA
jgi:hypothetical protein